MHIRDDFTDFNDLDICCHNLESSPKCFSRQSLFISKLLTKFEK